MNRIVALVIVVSLLGVPLSGCTNIKDDSTRTKTEGTLAGAGLGAAIGAGIGALAGGGRGALIGASIGATVGGLGGLLVGTHIADQKAKFASEEAWLDACMQRAEQTNTKLKEYNQELTGQIASLDKETKQLQTAYAAKKVDIAQLVAERKKIEGKIQENAQLIAGIEQEIAGQQKVLANAQASKKSDESALLDAEIAALKRQKTTLEESNKQLAAMSARISV
ncbi:MAG: hypothetical protein LBC10_02385 [Deltaproteobacteria bacterium]|jgi:peptidoglycan hydrolase CwlO-like protein|nr:hypothetical protein [Deltaproteobacteria bacterium]